jgi:hypothetical protein
MEQIHSLKKDVDHLQIEKEILTKRSKRSDTIEDMKTTLAFDGSMGKENFNVVNHQTGIQKYRD